MDRSKLNLPLTAEQARHLLEMVEYGLERIGDNLPDVDEFALPHWQNEQRLLEEIEHELINALSTLPKPGVSPTA
jgi:hypothetical protein